MHTIPGLDLDTPLQEEQLNLHEKLYMNIKIIYDTLPRTSNIRRPFLGALLRNLTHNEILSMGLHISKSTYYNYVPFSDLDSNPLFDSCSILAKKGGGLFPNEQEYIRDIWKECCPTDSGGYRFIRKRTFDTNKYVGDEKVLVQPQRKTNCKIYEFYKERCNSDNVDPVSLKTFVKYKPYYIKPARFLTKSDYQGICNKCYYYHIIKDIDDQAALQEIANQYDEKLSFLNDVKADYTAHLDRARLQKEQYKIDRNNLDENTALVVQDFASHYVRGTSFGVHQVMSDLVLVLYYRNEEGRVTFDYYDYVANHGAKSMFSFVAEVWWEFIEVLMDKGFKRLIIYSDGGPQHFTVNKTLGMFGCIKEFSRLEYLRYNFFEANHGTCFILSNFLGGNACDSHTGNIKQLLEMIESTETVLLDQIILI